MKKLIEKIAKNPKKIKRRLILGLIVFGLVLLIMPDVTFADGLSSLLDGNRTAENLSGLIKMISHIVYVFIWPCLVIAGTALDNSLVYGSFLHLDAALWNIWNIMKNFANFALGFLFVFTIVVNLFKGVTSKADPMKNAVDTIKSTFVAGVLVQMSWFLVAVLIDLSTILIYAVGGLPLTMLPTYNGTISNTPIMKLNAKITNNDNFYYYSYGDHNFSPCLLVNKGGDAKVKYSLAGSGMSDKGEYIAGREMLYLSTGVTFETGYCTLNGYLYHYEESDRLTCSGGVDPCYSGQGITWEEKNTSYYTQLTDYIKHNGQSGERVEQQKNACFLVRAYNVDTVTGANGSECVPLCVGSGYGAVPNTGEIFMNTENKFTIKDLMDQSKGWVGPFVTMYSSLLGYQELVMNPDSGTTMGTLFGLILNTFFALMLFLPIAILAVLLVMRIGYLWVVVAISPILVLVHTFGKGPLKKLAENKIFQKFSVKEIMTQIFSPIIVVFAISLCMVFLTTIFKSMPEKEQASNTLKAFGIEYLGEVEGENAGSCGTEGPSTQVSKSKYSILGLVDVEINAQNYNHGKDIFVRVLLELMATGLVRFFMKFAIGMMGKRGEELMSTAEKFVTSLPVIKLPGVEGKVGLHALGIGERNSNKIINNINSKVEKLTNRTEQDDALRRRITGEGKNDETVAEVMSYLKDHPNMKYNDLSDLHKQILTSAYGNDVEGKFDKIKAYYHDVKNEGIISAGKNVGTPTKAKTNADAVKYNQSQMNTALLADSNWKAWASAMVGGSVQLQNGVFMVDYIPGTEQNNPEYRIVTREDYEKQHFGNKEKTLDQVDKATYDANKSEIDAYLKELKQELERLKDLQTKKQNNETLSTEEETVLTYLQKLETELKNKTYSVDDIKTQLGIQ